LEGNPVTLDPRLARDAYSTRLLPLLFHFLVQLNAKAEIIPDLALSWEQPDPLTFVFHLRPGLRFSTGQEVSAQDVVYTLTSMADPELRSPHQGFLARLREITALDAHTVRLQLKEPYAPLLTELVLGIVPEAEARRRGKEFSRRPVGSGPYRLLSWEQGGEVALEPNPHFAGPAPRLQRLVFRVLPDDVTRIMALERGEIQLLLSATPPDDMAVLEKNPRLRIVSEPGISYTYLGFNLADPILAHRAVREAIAHAIPRDELVSCLFHGQARPATGLLAPEHWAYEGQVETYDYDPARAKALLDQAGYPAPPGGGPRFHLLYKTSQNKLRRWMAEAIAYSLGEVGIEVEVRSLEFGTLFADIQAGNFQLYSLTWVGVTEPDIYYNAFNSKSLPPVGANRGRYRHPEIDRLTEAGRAAFNPVERRALYSQVQKILAHDLPYVSLFYSTEDVVMDRKLQGFVLYPEGDYRSLAQAYWSSD
jgi:peptide/nickel transport system substrate-binding protein